MSYGTLNSTSITHNIQFALQVLKLKTMQINANDTTLARCELLPCWLILPVVCTALEGSRTGRGESQAVLWGCSQSTSDSNTEHITFNN